MTVATKQGWAAGLFEGEGSVARLNERGVSLSLSQTGDHRLAMLERFMDVVGHGYIVEVRRSNPNPAHAPESRWICRRAADVAAVMEMLGPHMTPGNPKAARYEELLSVCV